MSRIRRVLLVGHCAADAWVLDRAVKEVFKGVEVESANDQSSIQNAGADELLLVNRVLDGRFNSAGGIDLIQRMKDNGSPAALMLISNFAESQDQAVEAGALPGFGKSDTGSQMMVDALRAVEVNDE